MIISITVSAWKHLDDPPFQAGEAPAAEDDQRRREWEQGAPQRSATTCAAGEQVVLGQRGVREESER